MENKEEVLQALHEFENMTDADKVLTHELEQLLDNIAQTGRILYPWNSLKPVFMFKMDRVMREFFESSPSRNTTSSEPTHMAEFEVMRQRLLDCLEAFTSPPFTAQRLCELMVEPKRHYKNSEKFMRGIEKNVLVVSTMIDEESEEHAINNIDAAQTVPSIPNGPSTNGIMTSALPTEMQSVNTSDTNERLSAHDYEAHYPSQQEVQNHVQSGQTNGNNAAEGETDKEKSEEQTTTAADSSSDEESKEDSKTEDSEQDSASIDHQDSPEDATKEATSQSETQESADSKGEETEGAADKSAVEEEPERLSDEANTESPQDPGDVEEPMDEN